MVVVGGGGGGDVIGPMDIGMHDKMNLTRIGMDENCNDHWLSLFGRG